MSTENDTDRTGAHRYLPYHVALGVVAGASVIAYAFLPQPFVGFAVPVLIVLIGLARLFTDRYAGTRSPRRMRRGRWAVIYLVALAVVLAAAYILIWIFVRGGDEPWLAWVMATLVLGVCASGAWIVGARSTDATASAA